MTPSQSAMETAFAICVQHAEKDNTELVTAIAAALDAEYGRGVEAGAEQYKPQWETTAEANAAGFNEGHAERDALRAEAERLKAQVKHYIDAEDAWARSDDALRARLACTETVVEMLREARMDAIEMRDMVLQGEGILAPTLMSLANKYGTALAALDEKDG